MHVAKTMMQDRHVWNDFSLNSQLFVHMQDWTNHPHTFRPPLMTYMEGWFCLREEKVDCDLNLTFVSVFPTLYFPFVAS